MSTKLAATQGWWQNTMSTAPTGDAPSATRPHGRQRVTIRRSESHAENAPCCTSSESSETNSVTTKNVQRINTSGHSSHMRRAYVVKKTGSVGIGGAAPEGDQVISDVTNCSKLLHAMGTNVSASGPRIKEKPPKVSKVVTYHAKLCQRGKPCDFDQILLASRGRCYSLEKKSEKPIHAMKSRLRSVKRETPSRKLSFVNKVIPIQCGDWKRNPDYSHQGYSPYDRNERSRISSALHVTVGTTKGHIMRARRKVISPGTSVSGTSLWPVSRHTSSDGWRKRREKVAKYSQVYRLLRKTPILLGSTETSSADSIVTVSSNSYLPIRNYEGTSTPQQIIPPLEEEQLRMVSDHLHSLHPQYPIKCNVQAILPIKVYTALIAVPYATVSLVLMEDAFLLGCQYVDVKVNPGFTPSSAFYNLVSNFTCNFVMSVKDGTSREFQSDQYVSLPGEVTGMHYYHYNEVLTQCLVFEAVKVIGLCCSLNVISASHHPVYTHFQQQKHLPAVVSQQACAGDFDVIDSGVSKCELDGELATVRRQPLVIPEHKLFQELSEYVTGCTRYDTWFCDPLRAVFELNHILLNLPYFASVRHISDGTSDAPLVTRYFWPRGLLVHRLRRRRQRNTISEKVLGFQSDVSRIAFGSAMFQATPHFCGMFEDDVEKLEVDNATDGIETLVLFEGCLPTNLKCTFQLFYVMLVASTKHFGVTSSSENVTSIRPSLFRHLACTHQECQPYDSFELQWLDIFIAHVNWHSPVQPDIDTEDMISTGAFLTSPSDTDDFQSISSSSGKVWRDWFYQAAATTASAIGVKAGVLGLHQQDVMPLTGIGLALATCGLIFLIKRRSI